jgi:prepilin-type N-terminal cleavage/methylation domain-containing protein
MDRSGPAPLTRLAEDSGFSLVELMVVFAVMGVVMTAFLGLLASVQRSLVRETNRSATMDQARLALEGIDRQVRSGSIMCVPTTGTSPYYTLTLYGPNAYSTSSSTNRWVQYQVQSQTLQRRQYTSSWSAWRTVATGILNSTPTGTTTNVPFFPDTASQYAATSGASRLVNVTFVVNSQTSDATSSNTKVQSAIAIRNQDSTLSCISVPIG